MVAGPHNGIFFASHHEKRLSDQGLASAERLLPTTPSWGGIMVQTVRRPEEILAYRTLQQILVSKPRELWTARPADSVLSALQTMADKKIGLVVILDQRRLVGVVSERDCVLRAVLVGKPLETTPVSDIMTHVVITVDIAQTFADCLRLMHQNGIRHLPVVERGNVIAVVSVRDLLREAVAHNAKIIAELERERLSIFTSMA
jgi:CBS domain-containing protein